jgi:hypothetical protein
VLEQNDRLFGGLAHQLVQRWGISQLNKPLIAHLWNLAFILTDALLSHNALGNR